jgi:hypothetical protein
MLTLVLLCLPLSAFSCWRSAACAITYRLRRITAAHGRIVPAGAYEIFSRVGTQAAEQPVEPAEDAIEPRLDALRYAVGTLELTEKRGDLRWAEIGVCVRACRERGGERGDVRVERRRVGVQCRRRRECRRGRGR